MNIGWMALPWLLAAMPPAEPATCGVVVGIGDAKGRDLPEGLWARAQTPDGEATAKPLTDGSARLAVPCGPVRIDIGSSPREADAYAATSVSAYQLRSIVTTSAVTEPGREAWVSLVLPETAVVEFEALGPDGSGVLGFSADLIPVDNPATSWSLRSGSDGGARLRAPLGVYRLFCSHPDLQRLEVDGVIVTSEKPDLVPVTLTSRGLHITARFAGEVGMIRGAVKTSEGAGLASLQVTMKDPAGVSVSSAVTDQEGGFRDPVVRPPVEVEPVDPSWTFQPATRTCRSVPCQADFTALPRQDPRLQVRVVDPSGAPVSQASVVVASTCDPRTDVLGQPTDGEGRVSVPCPGPCHWRLWIAKRGWLSLVEEHEGVACQEELVLTLRRGAVVRGRLLDAQGQPVSAFPITVRTSHAPEARSFTDGQGRFELQGLSAGPQLLRIGDEAQEERALQRCDGPCGPATVDPLEGAAQVNLRLVPGGRICAAARANGALSGACLRVYSRGSAVPLAVSDGAWGQDPVCSDPLPPGSYEVRVDCPFRQDSGMATWVPGVERREDAQPILVRAGERTRLGQVPLVPSGEVDLVFSEAAHASVRVRAVLEDLAKGFRRGERAALDRQRESPPVPAVQLEFREMVSGSEWKPAQISAPTLHLRQDAWPPITYGCTDLPSGTWQLRLSLGDVVLESEAPVQVRSGQQVEARLRPVP